MHRVLVVGSTGAGKTTTAKQLANTIDAPFYEMDALAIGPNWSTPPEFEATVAHIVAQPRWVFDSYGRDPVREAMWRAADTVVWLDYSLRVVMFRVVRRSWNRSVRRTRLYGDNVETWRGWVAADHPVWWALRQHGPRRRMLLEMTVRSAAHIRILRFTSPSEVDRWMSRRVARESGSSTR